MCSRSQRQRSPQRLLAEEKQRHKFGGRIYNSLATIIIVVVVVVVVVVVGLVVGVLVILRSFHPLKVPRVLMFAPAGLSMTEKCVTSRAYHKAAKAARGAGLSDVEVKAAARAASKEAREELQKLT